MDSEKKIEIPFLWNVVPWESLQAPGEVLHVWKKEMSQEIINLFICIYLLFGQ